MMYDTSKKIKVNIDNEFALILNPPDGKSADPRFFQKYFVNFWNEKTGQNETINFFVSNKLYLILCDLNVWNQFIKKLAHKGFSPLHFYIDNFDPGEDYMYLTMELHYEVR